MKNWIKGGIIGFVVWLVLLLLQTFTWKLVVGFPVEQGWLNRALLSIGIERVGAGTINTWIIMPVIFIMLGGILLLFYSKIKNRKKNSPSPTL